LKAARDDVKLLSIIFTLNYKNINLIMELNVILRLTPMTSMASHFSFLNLVSKKFNSCPKSKNFSPTEMKSHRIKKIEIHFCGITIRWERFFFFLVLACPG